MIEPYPSVRLKRRGQKRLRYGHLWIFSNELEDGFQDCEPGSIVRVFGSDSRFIGIASINPHSLIAARIFSYADEQIDADFLTKRVRAADRLRRRLLGEAESSYRIVNSEADGLPGFIVDRFEKTIVISALTAGTEKLSGLFIEIIKIEFSPDHIFVANDSRARELEGLPLIRDCIYGEPADSITIEQDGIKFLADPLHGQKTGFFLDQRANRNRFRSLFRGGESVLDLFSSTGGFGLYALKAGASSVTFVDSSERALTLCEAAVKRNGWSDRAQFIRADVFEFLKQEPGKFDVVSLDPPALAKSRAKASAAVRAYRDLNARAIACVKDGGLLATSSCSGLVTSQNWRAALEEAVFKSRRMLRFIAFGGQNSDHPILASMPETEYLKFAIAVVGG